VLKKKKEISFSLCQQAKEIICKKFRKGKTSKREHLKRLSMGCRYLQS